MMYAEDPPFSVESYDEFIKTLEDKGYRLINHGVYYWYTWLVFPSNKELEQIYVYLRQDNPFNINSPYIIVDSLAEGRVCMMFHNNLFSAIKYKISNIKDFNPKRRNLKESIYMVDKIVELLDFLGIKVITASCSGRETYLYLVDQSITFSNVADAMAMEALLKANNINCIYDEGNDSISWYMEDSQLVLSALLLEYTSRHRLIDHELELD